MGGGVPPAGRKACAAAERHHHPGLEGEPPAFTTTGLRYAHAHSIYLQILMELGVPGLVLCAAFLCCLIPRAWHVLMDGGTPLWQRLTVLPVVMILLGELVECHTMPGLMLPFVPVVYTGMGVVCGLGRSRPTKG